MTFRAVRILREVSLIAAEDTRHTRKLLNHYGITTPSTPYHEHNKLARLPALLTALQAGDVALVSDAGTPAVNDPGRELVAAAIEAGFPVTPIPGPSAPIAALIASGLPTDRWVYLGFLPSRTRERRQALEEWQTIPTTLICFEAPHRLRASLRDIHAVLGNRQITVARELTKLHEEWVRGDVESVSAAFEDVAPRGEITLVIAGYRADVDKPSTEPEPADWRIDARERLIKLRATGMSGSTAAKHVARELKQPRGQVYELWTTLPPGGTP